MKIGQAAWMLLGIMAALLLACCAVIWLERKFPGKKYDERQHDRRGRGYRFSWIVGGCYYLAVTVILIWQTGGEKAVEPYLLVFGGLVLQIAAFDCYNMLTDAALPPSQKPLGYIVTAIMLGVLYLISVPPAELPLVGEGSEGWIWLMVGTVFLFRGITMTLRQCRKVRE